MFGYHQQKYSYQHPGILPIQSIGYGSIGYGSMPRLYPSNGSVFCLGESDVNFIENNNLPFDAIQLRRTMNSNNPHDCLRHMKVQEYLRDNYGRKIDDTVYEKNYKNAYKKDK